MSRVFDVTIDQQRRDRTSVKWKLWPDVLPLWVAEMDARPCEPVVEAVDAAMRRGDTGYTLGADYVEAFTGWADDMWGWSLDGVRAQVVGDVMSGVIEAIRLVCAPGGPVVISPPVYDSFYLAVDGSGRRVVEAPLAGSASDGYRLDPAALERAFVAATRDGRPAAYVLCNPQNPTGTVHTRDELETVAVLAARHGVRVISDEIHAPLVYNRTDYVPYLTVDPTAVAIHSPSKGWNLAGLKSALYLVGPHHDRAFPQVPEVFTHAASHIGVIAHTAALREGRAWLDHALGELDENRRMLGRLLAERLPGVGYHLPDATYLAWLDLRALGLGDDPAAELRRSAQVALSSGHNYWPDGGRGFARLNFATAPADHRRGGREDLTGDLTPEPIRAPSAREDPTAAVRHRVPFCDVGGLDVAPY